LRPVASEHGPVVPDVLQPPAGRGRRAARSWALRRVLLQLLIVALFLAGWEYLPKVGWLSSRFRVLDPFIISAPSDIAETIRGLATGHAKNYEGIELWPYLKWTLQATVEGTALGLLVGALTGLLFSQSRRLSDVLRPFIVLLNTVPRVALIPIFIILARPTITAEILSVVAVVFFLAYFNAFEGGRSVSQAMLDNASLLGASSIGIMRTIRLPLVIKWTFAAVPNAISFGLVIAVTTELLAGLPGFGNLLLTAMTNLNANLTFAIIVVLSVLGLVLYFGAQLLYKLIVRW
jgi:NitT/TauT family transport system permease protein